MHSGPRSDARHGADASSVRFRVPTAARGIRRGSRALGAMVAVAAFAWLATTTQHGMPWDQPGERIAVTPGAVLACVYLALVFALLAPRIHARLAALREGRRRACLFDGALWHALCGSPLIFVGPGVYLCFALAGGIGMIAFRWLNTSS